MLQKTLLSGVLLVSGVLCCVWSTSTPPLMPSSTQLPASSAPSPAPSPSPSPSPNPIPSLSLSSAVRSLGTASPSPSPPPGDDGEDPLQKHLAAIIGVPTGLGLAFIGLGLCLIWLGCSAYIEYRKNKPDTTGTNLTNLPQSKSNTIPLGPVATSDPSSSHVLQVEPNEDPFKTEPDEPQGLSGQEVGGATIASPLDQEVGVESPIDPAMGGLVLQGKK